MKGEGGAILITESTIRMSQSRFFNNFAAREGGSIFITNKSSLLIHGTNFSNNTAVWLGSAIIVYNQSFVTINDSCFTNNSADDGGSIFSNIKSSLFIYDTSFENNKADSHGSAISIRNQSLITIHDSSLTSNKVRGKITVPDVESKGGGLYAHLNCTTKISDVRFIGNTAYEGGALYTAFFCQTTIFNSSLEANTHQTVTFLRSVSSNITDCRFFNNSMPLRFYSSTSSVNVTNTIFDNNSAKDYGGVLYVDSPLSVLFHNCSFTENNASEGGAIYGLNSNIRLLGCNFTRNSAMNGGVFAVTGYFFIDRCIMNYNTAEENGGVGVVEKSSQIDIMACDFF